MKEQNQISMDIVNPKAAGIDIGSKSHFVAIGQKEELVREFGVYNEDLKQFQIGLKKMASKA
jgi:transposase